MERKEMIIPPPPPFYFLKCLSPTDNENFKLRGTGLTHHKTAKFQLCPSYKWDKKKVLIKNIYFLPFPKFAFKVQIFFPFD